MFDLKWAMASFPKLKDAQGRLDAKRKDLASIFAEAGPELDPAKVKSVAVADGAALRDVIAARNDELNELKDEVDGLVMIAKAAYDVRHNASAAEPGDDRPAADRPDEPEQIVSIGDAFVASGAYTGWKPGIGIGPTAKLDIGLASLLRPRATLFETGAGWAPESVRTGLVTLAPTRPAPHVIDFIPQIPHDQAAYVYMEETTFTNNAVEKAEGVAFGEAVLVLTERTLTVRKIPVWLPVTDEQLEDVPGARAYVEARLVHMVRQRFDSQVLVGSGVAPNLEGTENVVGIQTQALGTDPVFDAAYKAFRKIRDDGFAEPSVFFIAPAKWETFRLTRTADGVYILGNPADPGPMRLWGVPGVETTAAPATKLLAGDYAVHSLIAVRRGVDVQVTNSHSTHFTEGKQAIRVDIRVAMVHIRPKAFAAVTGL